MAGCRRPRRRAEKRRAPRDRGTFGDGPFNTFEDFTLYDRCITRGIVGSVLRVIYGNGNRIVQSPGIVAFSYEMIHDTRIIYTDGRPHIGQSIRQYLGDSRARWEGDVLVVETTNLTDKTSIGGNGNGLRHSDKMKITEQFKRVADDVLQYQFTVDDPVTYARPFTMSMPLTPLSAACCCPTSVTKATSPCRTRSARSAPRIARSPKTWPKASSGRGVVCRKAASAAAAIAAAAPAPVHRRQVAAADAAVIPKTRTSWWLVVSGRWFLAKEQVMTKRALITVGIATAIAIASLGTATVSWARQRRLPRW